MSSLLFGVFQNVLSEASKSSVSTSLEVTSLTTSFVNLLMADSLASLQSKASLLGAENLNVSVKKVSYLALPSCVCFALASLLLS